MEEHPAMPARPMPAAATLGISAKGRAERTSPSEATVAVRPFPQRFMKSGAISGAGAEASCAMAYNVPISLVGRPRPSSR